MSTLPLPMRYTPVLLLAGLLLSAAGPAPADAPAPTEEFLVVPGQSLGHTQIGAPASSLRMFGRGAYDDAAMQKAWSTWFGPRPADSSPRSELDIYTAPQNNDVDHHTVQIIRATSPWFHLANRLRVGSSLEAIRAAYGKLPLAATYPVHDHPRYLYDDVARGIAFETDAKNDFGCCVALIVHAPGKPVMQTELSMPEYLKEVPEL